MAEKQRKDPEPVEAATFAPAGTLINGDRRRHYVMANTEPGAFGNVSWYEAMGYRPERAVAGGVRISMGDAVDTGDPLRFQGMLLMSCSKKRKAEIDAVGPDGTTGRNLAQRVQQKINRVGLQQVQPGIARVVSETAPLIVEG